MLPLLKTLTRLTVVCLLLTVAVSATSTSARPFPTTIDLPNGWQPEGIVTGRGPVLYAGSLANGGIYTVDLRTGEGRVLVEGEDDRMAVGLSFDQRTNYIFVAGGETGRASVYNARTGELVADYQLAPAGANTFINDVIVTREAVYFTSSFEPVLYRLPLGPGGRLPGAGSVEAVPLLGEYEQGSGFGANGIEATPNGKWLVVVNSSTGLYRVDPDSGVATAIAVSGGSVTSGDGLLLQGSTLYVVRNFFNQIAVVKLAPDLSTGKVVDTITNPNFDIPTTAAMFGNGLYAVNARFSTTPTPTTTYSVIRVTR